MMRACLIHSWSGFFKPYIFGITQLFNMQVQFVLPSNKVCGCKCGFNN